MSNKIVPSIYRAVIDDVVLAIKTEFDEFGVPEEVLAELQHKWQNKVIASRVAEFESQVQQPAVSAAVHPVTAAAHHHAYQPHPMHLHYAHNPYAAISAPAPANQTIVKSEPMDPSRYILNTVPYAMPPLPSQSMNGSRQLPLINPGGQTGVFSFKAPQPAARPYVPPTQSSPAQPAQRIPQVDGPSESSDQDSPSPPPSGQFAPRASHPSLPLPTVPKPSPPTNESEEAINSDLDDSETEGEDEQDEVAAQDTDIVFCTYDKVARVKNKWKCTLKDGMIHIKGKDYLFAKCTGEFEW